MDMDDALEEWLKQVSKAAELSINDQEKITKAGADVYAKKLAETTKEKHPNTKGTGGKYGHLSEDISGKKGDIDGDHNGSSTVGFGDKAFVARFLNDGTKKIHGDHFVDNARDDAKDAVFAAEQEEYQAIIAKLNGGGDK
ncbi:MULTISPECIES: HK97-gp10 family putative phage morphogenesis protein [Lacticaseibacillus]|uniref:Phage head-tail joining protein n=1 Tax=Lacticaseibacillus casei DSM 20011 = JCM 1134 = ATCC 393 TaxID=1423732 RepID=A0AAD1ESR1_LACCA|nr:HK97-gp10 family putative phage morphogenesis protein [Lacticaseibacillus casei]MBI6596901.1 HK97 gp10 family phage protein [Lacticaseibacillus casei]MBO1482401.1 HK97 gp10 family phage protein [Lacticaseibacillus casei]MBO2417654.1 HK97 gp10 family phage protein [Lacticaseibacillus casei]MCK2080057.1 HK97 gp10 family phage protein [Lacticaseibacillus casei]MDZ5495997.1 HK97-gp10 family putative phage morphogenesis protein [Lacticaseibacillus casei]